jgi:hypothetical protein
MRKIIIFLTAAVFLLNIYGCIPLLVGGAVGAGTAAWLAQKLTQEFHAPYGRAVDATERALKSLRFEIVEINKKEDVTKFRSKDASGKAIWIDVIRIARDSTKVQVRVGAVSPDKELASRILKRIQRYL